MKIFENLNFEKPTPLFLSLTKNKVTDKLSLIKNDRGEDFTNDAVRNEYIVRKFEEIYENKDPDHMPNNIIENFLGDEIVNSATVRNSRLSEDESMWLDRPLTLAELDISVKKGKLRSAPGADGFSNALII
jgi:hypothetical protein